MSSLFPLEFRQPWHSVDQVYYTNSNASTVNTPIWLAGFGALVPIVSIDAATAGPYRRYGIFSGCIANGITISQGDAVYYVTASGCVTNSDPGGSGFLLGIAVEAGTAAGTATAPVAGAPTVKISLNAYYLPTSGAATVTSLVDSGNASVGGTLAVTGVTTQTGALNVTGAITGSSTLKATKINATAGRTLEVRSATALNTTGTMSAAAVYGGIVTSTSAAAVTATMPAAVDLLALCPGAVVGTSLKLLIANNAGANTVTVAASASITSALSVAGDLAVVATKSASYTIVFTNVTSGTEAAVFYLG